MVTMTDLRLADRRNSDREGRPCDLTELAHQLGRMTVLAISGGKCFTIHNGEGDPIGLLLPCGNSRAVEVVLDWNDTYSVRRVRLVTRGNETGAVVVESEQSGIYCDQVSETAYQASCWK